MPLTLQTHGGEAQGTAQLRVARDARISTALALPFLLPPLLMLLLLFLITRLPRVVVWAVRDFRREQPGVIVRAVALSTVSVFVPVALRFRVAFRGRAVLRIDGRS